MKRRKIVNRKTKILCGINSHVHLKSPPIDLVRRIKRKTTFDNPDYENAVRHSPYGAPKTMPKTVEFAHYDSSEDILTFPRGVDIKSELKDFNIKLSMDDWRNQAPCSFPELRITLNADQKLLLKELKNSLENNTRPFGTFLFIAGTSAGKTIGQSVLARELGQKTLILCPTNLIRDAWYKDLALAYGLNDDDVGIIQGPKFEFGENFTLASNRTLAERKDMWEDINRYFGTIVVDEAQTSGAKGIATFLAQSPAYNLLGATATDTRRDGKSYLVRNFLGDPVKRIQVSGNKTKSALPLKDCKVHKTQFVYEAEFEEGAINYSQLLEDIMMDEARNKLICDNVVKDWERGHSVLIVSRRVIHVEILAEMLESYGLPDVNILTGENNQSKTYSKNLTEAILNRSVRTLVASAECIKLGANINTLDRMHLTTPLASAQDLEQLVGRIRRRYKDKKDCMLHYYLDSKVGYCNSLIQRVVFPVMVKLKVPRYLNQMVA